MAVADARLYLQVHGLDIEPGDLDKAVALALKEREALLRGRAERDLSKSDLTALERMGANIRRLPEGPNHPVTRSVAAYAALIKTALSTDEVARMLGVTPSRVRQMLQDRELHGIRPDKAWLIPSFQVHEGALLPRLAAVIPHISPDAHPLGVQNFFLHPSGDLLDEAGEAMSPQEWLLTGGDPLPVARMAADL